MVMYQLDDGHDQESVGLLEFVDDLERGNDDFDYYDDNGEEEGESAESILRKLSLEEQRMKRQNPAAAAAAGKGEKEGGGGTSAEMLRRGMQPTPKHGNLGCGKQNVPSPLAIPDSAAGGTIGAPAVSERVITAAAIDAYGVLVDGDDYGAATRAAAVVDVGLKECRSGGGAAV